jgi:hypothetical protein
MNLANVETNAPRIAELRAEKDEFFRCSPHSPLRRDQQLRFTGLSYYPYDPALDLVVEVVQFSRRQDIQLRTNTGESRWYRRYGEFRFALGDEPLRLTVYQDANGFFLPFVDASAGEATYPSGRYLAPQPRDDDAFHIDFNQAYNPYCAYGDGWSCPVTPPENHLRVKIEAGEKLPTTI